MENKFVKMRLDQKIEYFEREGMILQKEQELLQNKANQFNAELKMCWGVGTDEQITIPAIVKLIREVLDASKASTLIRP